MTYPLGGWLFYGSGVGEQGVAGCYPVPRMSPAPRARARLGGKGGKGREGREGSGWTNGALDARTDGPGQTGRGGARSHPVARAAATASIYPQFPRDN